PSTSPSEPTGGQCANKAAVSAIPPASSAPSPHVARYGVSSPAPDDVSARPEPAARGGSPRARVVTHPALGIRLASACYTDRVGRVIVPRVEWGARWRRAAVRKVRISVIRPSPSGLRGREDGAAGDEASASLRRAAGRLPGVEAEVAGSVLPDR